MPLRARLTKKRCRDGGSILPRFIYLDLRLNVIPPIPALLRFPQPRNAHQEAAQIGQWILGDLRELIATIASASEDNRLIRQLLAGLRRVCHLGKKADHNKLQALAKEIRLGLGCSSSLR